MNTFEITREEIEDSKLIALEFELIKDYKEVYHVEFYETNEEYDCYTVRVYKKNRVLTEVAVAYVDSDLGSMEGYELNVKDDEELTNAILDKIAERIRVAYIQKCLNINGLSEVALNGYRYNIHHVYNFLLDEIADTETLIEGYLLGRDTMCISKYDFSKEDLLGAKTIQFYKSEKIVTV